MKDKRKYLIISIIIVCCIIMAVVDAVVQPEYAVKSGIKLVLFLLCPIGYSLIDKKVNIKENFKWNKRGIKTSIILGIAVYAIIVGAYYLTKDIFDFSGVTKSLTTNIGVSKGNFIWVSLYISFINSLLEEFFFRGFAFLTVSKVFSTKFAYIFSAAAFSLYHIAMMVGWFSLPVYILIIVGLFIGGIIFDYLNSRNENIYSSWMVHMAANFAINTIGFILFGIL